MGPAPYTAYLEYNNWNDYGFHTGFHLIVFDENSEKLEIGLVKIGFENQLYGDKTKDRMKKEFYSLDNTFFSLGQEVSYYKNLYKLDSEFRNVLVKSLRDVVQDSQIYELSLKHESMTVSLMRNISHNMITGQFKRILEGGAELTEYDFNFNLRKTETAQSLNLSFQVNPDSNPPTNIHVLIGKNGAGKTFLLESMVSTLNSSRYLTRPVGTFSKSQININNSVSITEARELFAGSIFVSFSTFDKFIPFSEERDKSAHLPFTYVGPKLIVGEEMNKSSIENILIRKFENSLTKIFERQKQFDWIKVIEEIGITTISDEFDFNELRKVKDHERFIKLGKKAFEKFSSGHAIVVLTLTRLSEKMEEKTLVLIDEPETHLHPPLLSSFIRVLSTLATRKNGVVIMATHSPVVLQEVPKSCVSILRRPRHELIVSKPKIETFAENIDTLTSEIFNLEVFESGFSKLLKNSVNSGKTFEQIEEEYNYQIGFEGKVMLRSYIAQRDNGDKLLP